jgi:Putative auto-transporter adhesin, head GIN domain
MTNSYLLLASLGSLWLMGCDIAGIDGNGRRQDETRDVAAFSRIRSDSELDVKVTQGDEQSVSVSLDSNLLHLVDTRVSGDTLYVDLHDNVDQMVDGPHVLITLPELTAAKLAGSGSMTLAFDEPSMALDLYLSGSGNVSFEGTTAVMGAYLSGSGDIRLAGATSDVDMALSGSGSIRGQHLATGSASIDLSGSGDISATVQDSVKVSLSGSGEINLFGDASVDEYRNTGSGDVVRH